MTTRRPQISISSLSSSLALAALLALAPATAILALLPAATSAADFHVDTIPLDPGIVNGFGAEDVVVNPLTNRIYTANCSSNSVSVVDGSTNTFSQNIAAGDCPSMIAVNTLSNKIFVVNEHDETVSVIGGSTNTVEATVPVGSSPSSLIVHEGTSSSPINRVYVANSADGTVSVINGATNTVEATIPVGDGGYSIDLGINSDTKIVYAATMSSSGGDVSVIDGDPDSPSFNTVITTIPLGFGDSGELIVALNETANKVYVLNGSDAWDHSPELAIIDGATNTLAPIIPLPVSDAETLAVSGTTDFVYLGHMNGILIFDGSGNPVAPPDDCCDEVEQIVINETTNSIYAATEDSGFLVLDGNPVSPTFHEIIASSEDEWRGEMTINEVTNRFYEVMEWGLLRVFDGVTNSLIGFVSTGGTAMHLAFDGVNGRVWVAHTSGDGIKRIDTTTNNVTALDLEAGVADVLFNPNTNRLYANSFSVDLLSESIKVINAATLDAEVDIPVDNGFGGWAMNFQTNLLYVNDGSEVDVIDGEPTSGDFNTVIAELPIGGELEEIAINENTNFIYVGTETADGVNSYIHVIDGTTNSLLPTPIEVGIAADVIVVNQATNRIYTSDDGSEQISVIEGDPASGDFHTVIATIPLAASPEELLVNENTNENTNRLYVNVDGNSTIVVINCDTHIIEAVLPLASDEAELEFALDRSLDLIYATDEDLGVVYVIDGSPAHPPQFNTIIETVEVGESPRSIVVDETSHRVYVANFDDDTVSVISMDDTDGDGVGDPADNCLDAANPAQIDTDGDGCGNQCDADFTQDGIVGSGDFFRLANAYGLLVPPASPNIDIGPDPLDGAIGAADFFTMASSHAERPGPSGTTSGTTACP